MKLKQNFIYQFSYQILAIIVPLITTPYVSRVLHPEGIGDYAYTFTVVYYFFIACMLGFDTHGQRLVAQALGDRERRSRAFSEVATLQAGVTLLGSVVYILYTVLSAERLRLITAVQFFYLASAAINVIWLFEGVEEFRSVALRNIAVQIVSCVLIFTLVKEETDLWKYTAIMAGSAFAGNLLFLATAGRHVDYRLPRFRNTIAHLKPALLLFVPQIGITVFMQMDKLMLGWWSTSRQLGYYQNAEKVVSIPVALILTVGTVIMPRIITLRAEKRMEEVRKYNSFAFDLLMVIGIGCTFGLTGIAHVFTPWYFGEEFRESADILSILSAQVAFMTWENVLQKQYLVPFEKDAVVIRAMTFAAGINVVLNTLLIPGYGSVGAIIGSLVAHLFICCYEGVILRRELPIRRYLGVTLALGAAGAVMCAAVRMLSRCLTAVNPFFQLVILIAAGGLLYLAMAAAILRWMHSDVMGSLGETVKRIKGRIGVKK